MDTMLQEYQEQLKRTRALKRSLPNESPEEKDRHRIIAGIITDLEIAAYVLETGAPPGYRRKGVYGTTHVDPFMLGEIFPAPDPFETLEEEMDKTYAIGKQYGLKGNKVFAVMKWQEQKRKSR